MREASRMDDLAIVVERFCTELNSWARSGIGKAVGLPPPAGLELRSLPGVAWASSLEEAVELQSRDELNDFLLFLRPELDGLTQSAERAFGQAMNDVAALARPAITNAVEGISWGVLPTDPDGWRPSHVQQTLTSVAISATQETVARHLVGLLDPLPALELLGVYRAGHILCGYRPAEECVVLF